MISILNKYNIKYESTHHKRNKNIKDIHSLKKKRFRKRKSAHPMHMTNFEKQFLEKFKIYKVNLNNYNNDGINMKDGGMDVFEKNLNLFEENANKDDPNLKEDNFVTNAACTNDIKNNYEYNLSISCIKMNLLIQLVNLSIINNYILEVLSMPF